MLNATLIKRTEVTTDLLIFGVKPDKGISDFLPGQYVALGLPGSAPRPAHFPPDKEPQQPDKLIKRAYSIGSSPLHKEYLEFYIAILPEGALSSRLVCLKEGDRIFAAPKITGTFTLEGLPADANLILVATGTGIAPYMSMLRMPSTWTAHRKIALLHGVRYESDLAYHEELFGLAKERSEFSYYQIVSRPGSNWKGQKGYVQRFFQEGLVSLTPMKDHVFLCGNPGMIDEMEKLLVGQGYIEHSKKKPGDLHLERYW